MNQFFRVIVSMVLCAGAAVLTAHAEETVWLNLGDGSAPYLFEPETREIPFSPAHMDQLRCLGDGWKNPNTGYLEMRDDGLWCTSLVSKLHLNIVTPRARELYLKLRPHLVRKLGPQIIEVFWGDTRLGICAFDLDRGWDFVDFVLPVPAEAQQPGDNRLTLNAHYAVSARSMETGDDGTIYAYAIQRLALREANGELRAASELTFADGVVSQPPYSRLILPFRVPAEGATRLRVDGARGGDATTLTLRRETLDGVTAEILATAPADAINVALDQHAGAVLEAVFSTGAESATWAAPRLSAAQPPAAALPYAVKGTPPKARNVVLILCDAMARGHLGSYGATRSPSPVMDQLAAEGVRFAHAYASASYTYSSTWSLLTGLYPFQHDAPETPLKVDARVPRLAQVLSAAGVHTGVVSSQQWIAPAYSTTEHFDEYLNAVEPPNAFETAAEPELVTQKAADFIARNKAEPFFLYLHYRPPHEPYYPPEQFKGTAAIDPAGLLDPKRDYMKAIKTGERGMPREERRLMEARYAEMIRSIDTEIAAVVDTLRDEGLAEDTLIIVTSDHGEAFMEHGWLTHGHTLYEEVTGIPLILWGAGVTERFEEGVVTAPVGNVTLFPTITEALGVDAPDGIAAHSLFSPRPVHPDTPRTMAQNSWRNRTHLWDPLDAYWWEHHKFIIDPVGAGLAVYDLLRDPEERSDLSRLRPVLRNYLWANAAAWRRTAEEKFVGPATVQEIQQTKDSLNALDALGYL